jgi:chemotaxis protein CheD
MPNSLAVGLGEIKISNNPQDVLVAYGLGSCLGIGFHDPVMHISGLLHAILPSSPDNGHRSDSAGQPGKYVDSGIAALLSMMIKMGADRRRLIVRYAGGANMLTAPGFSQVMNIGSRNTDVAVATLSALTMKVCGHEVGGNIGRTVRFYVTDGRMTIRTVGNQEREI